MKIQTTIIIILSIVLGIALGCIVYLYVQQQDLRQENELYGLLLKTGLEYGAVSPTSQKAMLYYGLAGSSYELQDYNAVEQNCLQAREFFHEESLKYEEIKTRLKFSGAADEFISIYIEILDESVIQSLAFFEACEYFESAARYYSNGSELGNGMIEMMNERISDRDASVERYNELLTDFNYKLSQRLE